MDRNTSKLTCILIWLLQIYTIVCCFIKQNLNLLQLQFCKSSRIHHISNQPYHVEKFKEMQELRTVMCMLPAASSCFWSSNPTISFSACKYQIYTQFTVGVSLMPTIVKLVLDKLIWLSDIHLQLLDSFQLILFWWQWQRGNKCIKLHKKIISIPLWEKNKVESNQESASNSIKRPKLFL